MGIGIAPKPKKTTTVRSTTLTIGLLAGLRALGVLLSPGPDHPSFETNSINTASETEPWHLLAGTNRSVLNLIWYGDKAVEHVKNDTAVGDMILSAGIGGLEGYIAGGGHFGGTVPDPPTAYIGLAEGTLFGAILAKLGELRTYSWRFMMGRAYSIGHGRPHAITEIFDGDRRVAVGTSVHVGGSLLIDDPDAYGGDHKEGGFYAMADIIPGDLWPTQQPNPYLAARIGGAIPALSGKSAIVIRGPSGHPGSGYFFAGLAGAPPIKPFSITSEFFYNLLGVPEFSVIRDKDANPVEFMFAWMTGRTRGYGYGGTVPLEDFDYDAWRAAAEVVFNDGLGYSADIKDNVSVWKLCEDLCAFIGCFIYEHPVTGLITIKLVRPDYEVDELPVFDVSNVESVDGYTPGAYRDVPNEVRVKFIDRDKNFRERTLIAQNDAVQSLIETVQPKSFEIVGAGCRETAAIIGARELAASFPRPPVTLNTLKDGHEVQIGDLVVWSWPKYRVQQMVLRVLGKKGSDTHSNKVRLTCAMDVFGRGNVVTALPADTVWQPEQFHFTYFDFRIPQIQLSFEGFVADRVADITFSVPVPQFSFTGTVDVTAQSGFTIPMPQFSFTGTVAVSGTFELTIP